VTEAVRDMMNHENSTIPTSFHLPNSHNIKGTIVHVQDNNNNNNNNKIITMPNIIEVRGEVVLPLSVFHSNNHEHDNHDQTITNNNKHGVHMVRDDTKNTNTQNSTNMMPSSLPLSQRFSNARNAASGILLRSKGDVTQEEADDTKLMRSHLRFFAYDIVSDTVDHETNKDCIYNFLSSPKEKGKDIEVEKYTITSCSSNISTLTTFMDKLGFSIPKPSQIVPVTLTARNDTIHFSRTHDLFSYHEQIMSSRNLYSNKDQDSNHAQSPGISMKDNHMYDFEVDGAVYKLSSQSHRIFLGSSNRAPRWAIAHKFEAETAVTQILRVEASVGRTGAITPIAILNPVSIGGVNVSRASLHNYMYASSVLGVQKEIQKGKDSRVTVLVSRAGDVIPQVIKRIYLKEEGETDTEMLSFQNGLKHSENISSFFVDVSAPTSCPACGSETYFDIGLSDDGLRTPKRETSQNKENESISGRVLRCGGPQFLCKPRAVGALVHAYSRAGLDISGLSDARLAQLVDANLIRFPSDIFQILNDSETIVNKIDESRINSDLSLTKNNKGQKVSLTLQNLSSLPGWGIKSAQNLKNNVKNVAEEGVTLSRFIYSLGIRHIGTYGSKLIAKAYGTSSEFLKDVINASPNICIEANANEVSHEECDDQSFLRLRGDDTTEGIKGIGPVVLDSLNCFAKERELVHAAQDLASKINIISDSSNAPFQEVEERNDNDRPEGFYQAQAFIKFPQTALLGKTVVFTGKLPNDMSRTTAQELAIKNFGAKSTPGSISKSTDIVIEGEKAGKKVKKALELNIPVMSASDFLILVKEMATDKK